MPETSDPDCSGQAGIGAVLLAAGESTRMGRPKQLLEWAGRPLVQYQVQELQATSAQEIVVVLGHEADLLEPLVEEVMKSPRTHAVINPDYRQGKTTSIKTGLRNLRTAVGGVMLLAVDQPRPRHILQRLIDAHLTDETLVSVPTCGGKHGHPPLFHASLLGELLAITEERQGIREVIERHRDGLRAVAFDSPLVLTNINTPDDYRRARDLADA
ncbi:MAG: nucleotidyltransferase family protein [Chloroflexi bacterium]|nr:nucleotidyltransferase family protein [Chloroflexota bacterium]